MVLCKVSRGTLCEVLRRQSRVNTAIVEFWAFRISPPLNSQLSEVSR